MTRLANPVRAVAVAAAALAAQPGAWAASPAASTCPPIAFLSGNLAVNPDFEIIGPNGPQVLWRNGDPVPPPSAAEGWTMHADNVGNPVGSRIVTSTAPGAVGTRAIQIYGGGNESGIFQSFTLPQNQGYMFSVWVYVKSGRVAVQSSAGVGGPVAWSTKIGEWEQLRVCNNTQYGADTLIIYNQDPAGGMFTADRVELMAMDFLE